MGLRPQHYPTLEQDRILLAFIRTEYSQKTLEELILAFRLAIKDELDLKTEDIRVYDQFTPEYLGRIMTAYSKWLKDKNKQLPQPEPKMLFHNTITSEAEKLQDIAEWEAKDDLNIDFIPPYLYDYLVEFKKIDPSKKDKWTAMERATEVRKSKLQEDSLSMNKNAIDEYQSFLKMYESGEYVGNEINRITLIAKKIMVFDYLTQKKK